jgi:hypothetical protein
MNPVNSQPNSTAKPKSLSMKNGAIVFDGEGWEKYDMIESGGLIEQFARFHLTQEKLKQDSIVAQKMIEAATVISVAAAIAALLGFGMFLMATQPAQYQGSNPTLHKAV